MDAEINALFLKNQLRTTKPRNVVFKTLKAAASPLSRVDLAKVNKDIDKVSVYRTVDLFLKLGIVTAVTHGWRQRYELAAPFRPHHHHLQCTGCGKVEEIQSKQLEQAVHILASQQQFEITGHIFELTGLCRECQVKRNAGNFLVQ